MPTEHAFQGARVVRPTRDWYVRDDLTPLAHAFERAARYADGDADAWQGWESHFGGNARLGMSTVLTIATIEILRDLEARGGYLGLDAADLVRSSVGEALERPDGRQKTASVLALRVLEAYLRDDWDAGDRLFIDSADPARTLAAARQNLANFATMAALQRGQRTGDYLRGKYVDVEHALT